jgi:hypothetical protein
MKTYVSLRLLNIQSIEELAKMSIHRNIPYTIYQAVARVSSKQQQAMKVLALYRLRDFIFSRMAGWAMHRVNGPAKRFRGNRR